MTKLIAGITALIISSQCLAQSTDVYQERETLTRLLEQVNNLSPIVHLAESQESGDTRRHRFDYAALKQDLATIQSGLEHYLQAPLEPRKINNNLQGGYKTFNDK